MVNNPFLFQAPVHDHRAATGFLGLRPTTTRAHMVRALLESVAFRVAQLYVCTKQEADYTFKKIRYLSFYGIPHLSKKPF